MRLNTQPRFPPVNASPPPSRASAHGSGPPGMANPSMCGSSTLAPAVAIAVIAAMDALAADPNIGADASYRAGGSGVPVLLRVVRSAPDRLGDAFGTSVIQASDVLYGGYRSAAQRRGRRHLHPRRRSPDRPAHRAGRRRHSPDGFSAADRSTAMIDPERIGSIVGEALLAGTLGALGAMARFSSTDRPLLTRAYLLHALAGGSLGTGAWLIAHAFELDGWWLFAVRGWPGPSAMPRCTTCCCGSSVASSVGADPCASAPASSAICARCWPMRCARASARPCPRSAPRRSR